MKLSLLLVFVGVVGGIFAFGLLGLIVGPVLVALAQTAWREFIDATAEAGQREEKEVLAGRQGEIKLS